MTITKDYFVSKSKYLELNIKTPYIEMANEAKALKEHFITHRPGSYNHKGWKSLVLHGWSEQQTGHWKDYGYTSIDQVIKDLHWTKFSEMCPVTVNFVKNNFPSEMYGRVRFMLLEAGGYIDEHVDSRVPLLENTNVSLSNPEKCMWNWGDGESMFMTPGKTYVVNIHYPHSVTNNSNEDRYHLIIHRLDCTEEWKSIIETACIEQGVSGEYINHEVLI